MFAERPPSSQQRREDWPASGTVTDTSADERTVAGRMGRDMMSTTRAIIESLPRVSLATLPTPLTEAVGLRAALGGSSRCPRILLKRDDLTGLALGGNKARKLEFLIAAGPDPRIAVATEEKARVREVVDELHARGERPYVIPVGGSSGVGALGY